MKILSRINHSILDYSIGILLMNLHYFVSNPKGTDVWISSTAGLIVILYSLFTDSKLSVAQEIPIKIHFILDRFMGLTLIILSSTVHLTEGIYISQMIAGFILLLLPAVTKTRVDPIIHLIAE